MNLCYLVLVLHAEMHVASLKETFEEQHEPTGDDRDAGDSEDESHIICVVPAHEDN